MAQIKGKGTVFSVDVATVLTPVAQLTDVSLSGVEIETFDATTLDQAGAGKTLGQTGYSESGELSISGFFDPDNAQQAQLLAYIETPAEFDAAITFTDATPATWNFVCGGCSFDVTVSMNDAVKFSSTMPLSGISTDW